MLAIVIPYYKLSFFEETLKSLADQTDKRFKVYIGNDASSENPINIFNKYKPRINLKYKKFEEFIAKYLLNNPQKLTGISIKLMLVTLIKKLCK